MDESQKRIIIVVVIVSLMIACGLSAARLRPGSTPNQISEAFDTTPSVAAFDRQGDNSRWPTPTSTQKPSVRFPSLQTTAMQQAEELTEDETTPNCPGAPDPRLEVGGRAEVSRVPPYANRVRAQPSFDAVIVGLISPGEDTEVLGGPTCSGGYYWWRVRSIATDLTGWTIEGDSENYWLIPFEDG